jgi:hypothetical protein
MTKRRRFKQTKSLQERLFDEIAVLQEKAAAADSAEERDEFLNQAKVRESASQMAAFFAPKSPPPR